MCAGRERVKLCPFRPFYMFRSLCSFVVESLSVLLTFCYRCLYCVSISQQPFPIQAMASTLSYLRSKLGFAGKAGIWKFLALLFALLNLKNLPFAWHVRPTLSLLRSSHTSSLLTPNLQTDILLPRSVS